MQALFEKVMLSEQRSVLVRQFQLPYFESTWHYHPEYELTYIPESYGRRFVGDHVDMFQAGNLVLPGPDLPTSGGMTMNFINPTPACGLRRC